MRRAVLALLLTACTPVAAEPPWKLVEIGGDQVAVPVTLEFPEPGRFAGQAPCNRFFGRYEGVLPEFRPAGIGSTELACDALALETRFFAALAQAARADWQGDRVTVTGGGELLVFVRAAD